MTNQNERLVALTNKDDHQDNYKEIWKISKKKIWWNKKIKLWNKTW